MSKVKPVDDINPSYYAILTSEVRYSKQIPQGAKLLYAEITALCNEKGFCWASNSYFASLYDVSNRTISRWIEALDKASFITLKFDYHSGSKVVKHRYIFLSTGMTKMSKGYDKNVIGGMTKMSNRIININNKTNSKKKPFSERQAENAKQAFIDLDNLEF